MEHLAQWASLEGARNFGELQPHLSDQRGSGEAPAKDSIVDAVLARHRASVEGRYKRILHLSDLHFGSGEASRRNRYLRSQLEQLLPEVSRVVAEDIFDTPDRDFREQFKDFRDAIERHCKAELILIPGNHDVKLKGIFGRNYEYIADIGWKPIVIDEELRAVFFCFNSAEAGFMAKGRVSEQQLLDRAATYQSMLQRQPELSGYVKIAMVHHHPFPFQNEPPPTTAYERLVTTLFGRPDALLEFSNADRFIRWCGRGSTLVLHGHKHVPRQKMTDVGALVIGCGSSTGHGGQPMCYDIITLDPSTSERSASFYFDEGDGSGFELQAVTVEIPPS